LKDTKDTKKEWEELLRGGGEGVGESKSMSWRFAREGQSRSRRRRGRGEVETYLLNMHRGEEDDGLEPSYDDEERRGMRRVEDLPKKAKRQAICLSTSTADSAEIEELTSFISGHRTK